MIDKVKSKYYLKLKLKSLFGFKDFKSDQLEIIDKILNKRNILAVMPTGAGKSLCYQLPALISEFKTIMISPLVSLSSLNMGNGLNINDRQVNVISSDHCQPETGGVKGSLQPMKVRPGDLTQGMKPVKVSDDAGEKTKGGKRRRKTRKARKHRKTKKRGKYKKTRKRK